MIGSLLIAWATPSSPPLSPCKYTLYNSVRIIQHNVIKTWSILSVAFRRYNEDLHYQIIKMEHMQCLPCNSVLFLEFIQPAIEILKFLYSSTLIGSYPIFATKDSQRIATLCMSISSINAPSLLLTILQNKKIKITWIEYNFFNVY